MVQYFYIWVKFDPFWNLCQTKAITLLRNTAWRIQRMEKLEFAQKIKTCEQLALSCYMKRGYLGEAQPSLVLDASQIGHFHGIMWVQHILEDTDEGFLSNNSLAFFTHSSQLCLFQPYTNSLPPTESCFEYNSMDLEIVALSWALPFMGQSCQVAQHRFFKCKNKSLLVRAEQSEAEMVALHFHQLHQCALWSPFWPLEFSVKINVSVGFWLDILMFVCIKLLVKTGDIIFKMWLNEQGRT